MVDADQVVKTKDDGAVDGTEGLLLRSVYEGKNL